MEAVFLKLVNQSIAAGWLVLAVVVLRLVLRRAPRWSFCLLWGLVALRLLWPFSVESALSLVPSARPLPPEILYTAARPPWLRRRGPAPTLPRSGPVSWLDSGWRGWSSCCSMPWLAIYACGAG